MGIATLEYGTANSPTASAYYRITNQVRGARLMSVAAVAGTITLVGAFVYAWAILSVEHILIRPALPFAFGFALGFTWVIAATSAGLRRRPIVLMLAMLGTALGYYGVWVVWEVLLLRRGGSVIGWTDVRQVQPTFVFKLARLIEGVGSWKWRSGEHAVRGGDLLSFWLVEAFAIFGSAAAAVLMVFKEHAYCHTCKSQCAPAERIMRLNIGDAKEAKTRLEALDADYFRPLVLPPIMGNHFWSLQYEGCRRCESLTMLNLIDVLTIRSSRGGSRVKLHPLVKHLMVDAKRMGQFVSSLLVDANASSSGANPSINVREATVTGPPPHANP